MKQGSHTLLFLFPYFPALLSTLVPVSSRPYMRAVFYEEFRGPISHTNVPDPVPNRNGVVVKVEASGLCLSDWHGWMGHDPDIVLPHVPGHELAGTILAIGKGVKFWKPGDRVTVPFVGGCGSCVYCQEGDPQVCNQQFQPGFTAWGSFAEYVAIDYADQNLVRLPENMGFAEAASLGCRSITAFRGVVDQGSLKEGQRIAIFGCGGVGLSAIQIAKALGAEVYAVDIHKGKLEKAREFGADHLIDNSMGTAVEKIVELSGGGVHVSMDALGHTETCLQGINSLRKRGKHIQVGLMAENHARPPIPMDKVIAHELEIFGSHGMQASKYPEMFHLIQEKGIDLNKMIGNTISLSEVPELLPAMKETSQAGITVINNFR